jgi:hypothetical protein
MKRAALERRQGWKAERKRSSRSRRKRPTKVTTVDWPDAFAIRRAAGMMATTAPS